MKRLERLTQGEFNEFFKADGTPIKTKDIVHVGKIRPLVVQGSCSDISSVIDEMAGRDSKLIPSRANAYVASDFSGETQHVRKDSETGKEKMYSVYAVQFYYVYNHR